MELLRPSLPDPQEHDQCKFLQPYKRIRLQQQHGASLVRLKGASVERNGEVLAQKLAGTPCWFPIFDDLMPSAEELEVAQEKLRITQLQDPRSGIALGDLLLLQGEFEDAEASFNTVISSTSRSSDDQESRITAQVKLGMLLENLGRLDEAEFHLRRASSLDDCTHYGALKFLELFLFDHGSPKSFQELASLVQQRSTGFRRWWSNASFGHLLYESPLGFLKDLESLAWYGKLRLGLIQKLVQKNERLANQNLFVAHTSHLTHSLLALHLQRSGEVRDHWYKLVLKNGEPVESSDKTIKTWSDDDDKLLLESVAFQDPKHSFQTGKSES